jgi:serine O-acetyltransferase
MSAIALTLLRTSIALRSTIGSSLGTRAALRWIFKLDIWTDQVEGALALPHPFNIVIGSGVHIGRGCTIMHNVTLQHARHTDVGAGAVLGVGSVILADRKVGDGAFCGANSVVTRDVPAGAVVAGAPARVIKQNPMEQPNAA